MNDRPVPMWVWASLVLTALASLLTIVPRFTAEHENRAVGLVMEAENIRQIGLAEGKSYPEALKYLAEHGLTAVVMSDEVLGDAVGLGGLQVWSGAGKSTIVCPDEGVATHVLNAVQARFHVGTTAVDQGIMVPRVEVSGVDPLSLKSLSLGIDPTA
ncbi:MAG: hypothetical protein JSS65_12780, partial [Armatimonadetes bacterium]|nr:hypothetical protein [Armatimonadota bacterium]